VHQNAKEKRDGSCLRIGFNYVNDLKDYLGNRDYQTAKF
jgi:hypothetical protein